MTSTRATFARLAALVLLVPGFDASAQDSSQERKTAVEDAPIAVRYSEGVVHGFLVLRSDSGVPIAYGDLLQTPRREAIETRMVFHFKDGSLFDESVVFTQHAVFTMQSYHLVQRGPTFPEDTDFELDRSTNAYRLTTRDHSDHREQVDTGSFDLPPDVYNGMVLTIAKNLRAGESDTVHFVALTPKPRMIQLELLPGEEQKVLLGQRSETALHWVFHPKLGTLVGLFAKLLGKTPPDNHAWIVLEEVPAFVRFQGPLYLKGPIWRIELTVPVWAD